MPKDFSDPVFSEALAASYIQTHADDIGYRIVGTRELDQSIQSLVQTIEGIKASSKGGSRRLSLYHQRGSGSQLFDFMDKASEVPVRADDAADWSLIYGRACGRK